MGGDCNRGRQKACIARVGLCAEGFGGKNYCFGLQRVAGDQSRAQRADCDTSMIKVLIADDQTLVRQGFRSLLGFSDAVEVVAEAGDGEQVLQALGEHEVDVLLLDLQMPRMTGLQVLERIHQQGLGVSVIVLTTFDDDAKLLECARLGARGYLLKDVRVAHLVSALTRVAAG